MNEMNDVEKGYMIGRRAGMGIGRQKGASEGAKRVAVVAHALVVAIKNAAKEKNNDTFVLLEIATDILSREIEESIDYLSHEVIEHSDFGSEGSMALFHWLCPISKGDDYCTPSCISGSGGSGCCYFGGLQEVDDQIFIRCAHGLES